MPRRLVASLCLGFALALVPSCKSTLDSVSCNERNLGSHDGGTVDGGTNLASLRGPTSYPNAFRDLLGLSDSDIDEKINATFDQLFHGDPSIQAIYYTVGPDQAVIRDTYHGDIRTEGIGLGMMIAVEMGNKPAQLTLPRPAPGSLALRAWDFRE